MSRPLKFIWIDDDDRKRDADNLGRQLGIKCSYIDLKPRDVDYLKIIQQENPDLILVDHNLTKVGSGSIKKGSTIAALIREKHPTYPIACVTAQDISTIDSQQRLSYEAIFKYDDIKKFYLTMKAIALGYRKMKEERFNSLTALFSLVKAPEDDVIKLESITPREIKDNLKDDGVYGNVSRWVRDILMERPGFLFDRLWTATLLGLNESGFSKVEEQFKKAKYRGIFNDESKPLWWKSEVLNQLSKLVKQQGLPWEKGRHLEGINPRNFSKDYYSDFKEEYPEVVAFIDESSEERAPMKIQNTTQHPKYDKLLFFEEIRMMKAD